MKTISITELREKFIKFAKMLLHYSFIVLSLSATFCLGYYFNHIIELNRSKKPEIIKRSEVTIAIDEEDNVMVITKNDGSYTLLQDSVGKAIFNMYAKNIFRDTQTSETK